MHGLHELQRDFARSVLHGGIAVGNRIRPNGLTAAQRLAVYRNNTFMGLTEALKDGYPVVHRLVGDGFFNGLASAYVARHPRNPVACSNTAAISRLSWRNIRQPMGCLTWQMWQGWSGFGKWPSMRPARTGWT